jgi:outer membrane protein OmpA-like peptidoglycan-associated protein
MRRAITCLALLFALAATQAAAGDAKPSMSEKEFIESLKHPKIVTEEEKRAQKEKVAEENRYVDSIRDKPSLSRDERERVADIAEGRGALEFDIRFDAGSARLTPRAVYEVRYLARAVSQDTSVIVVGHTDASGDDERSLDLSKRRAEVVKRLLVRASGRPASHFITIGMGKERQKFTNPSMNAENRRVGIVVMDMEQGEEFK